MSTTTKKRQQQLSAREQFGRRVRQLRRAADITQRVLAERLGVRVATVTDWERAVREPETIDDMAALADALGVALAELFS